MAPHISNLPFWRDSFICAFLVFVVSSYYAFFASGNYTITEISMAIAATASILIGLSFALSGFCYYFDFLDKKIMYRKYLGLTGYWFAFVYCILLLILEPAKYFYQNAFNAEIVLGFLAMAILTFMVIISNTSAMRMLGPQNWRYGLRLGYIAYALLIVRAYIIEGDRWRLWILEPNNLPPLRLVLSVFALGVILFRISVMIAKASRKRTTA